MKNKRKVRRRNVQIIRALDLWFIRHKKQGCNNIAKRFNEMADTIAEMFADTCKNIAKMFSNLCNECKKTSIAIQDIGKNFEIRPVISSEAFAKSVMKTAESVIKPERCVAKTAKSVIKPERIDIKKKNTWHKKNWQRR